jgi:hypothetical protein
MMLLALILAAQAAAAEPRFDPQMSTCRGPGPAGAAWLGANHASARAAVWERRWSVTAFCAYEAASMWMKDDPEKALDLFWIGRARAQFDQGRCRGQPVEASTLLYTVYRADVTEQLKKLPAALRSEEHSRASLRRVLDDPKAFSPADDDLRSLCGGVEQVRPRAEWPAIAQRIRSESVALMEAAAGRARAK